MVCMDCTLYSVQCTVVESCGLITVLVPWVKRRFLAISSEKTYFYSGPRRGVLLLYLYSTVQ